MGAAAIDYSQAEQLGISHEAYDEVLDILGHTPTMDELSTLLAMWSAGGSGHSLYSWLRGQPHATKREEYIYEGKADLRSVREPRVRECLEIARNLAPLAQPQASPTTLDTGMLLYMVGNVSSRFGEGEYARRYLHLVEEPMATGEHTEDCQYIELILGAMAEAKLAEASSMVGAGGIFGSLLTFVVPRGFDILAPREVRLDAFLFGEEPGRYLVAIGEVSDDAFLLKLTEARLNCCFLGRTTKNRIVVDGFDFGLASDFA